LLITNNVNCCSNSYSYSNIKKKLNTNIDESNNIKIQNCSSKDFIDKGNELFKEGKITKEENDSILHEAFLATICTEKDGIFYLKKDLRQDGNYSMNDKHDWVNISKIMTANDKLNKLPLSQISDDERLENIINGL